MMNQEDSDPRRKSFRSNSAKGTSIELILAELLWNAGVRYRKNDRRVIGTPDFTVAGLKLAVFCDGEFWHGRDWERRKEEHKTNREFWIAKIERNIRRDREVNERLHEEGWTVLRFWETELKRWPDRCLNKVLYQMNQIRNKQESVSLIKCFSGLKSRLRFFGPHALKEDGTVMSFEEQMAVVTHFLHDRDNKSLKEKAEGLIEDWSGAVSASRSGVVAEETARYGRFREFFEVPFPGPTHPKFTFVDLFAGIGGFRMAMQNLGGKCVFSSEWDVQAQRTYLLNYGEVPFGDITSEEIKSYIPDGFDILCAGFPCQAFSLAGKRMGFEETRGTLFFDVAEVLRRHRPKAFFLENVKGLAIHDKGKTLRTILKVLREDLDYYVPEPELVNAMNFGVPQHRERIYIVGFRKDMNVDDFAYPEPTDTGKVFADVKEQHEVSV